MIRRQLDVLSDLFEEIIVVTSSARPFRVRAGLKVAVDRVDNLGPLGGLYTGLAAASGDGIFLVACDLPFLERELIAELIADFDCQRFDGRIPTSFSGLEPLHALYSKRIMPKVEAAVKAGDLSLQRLIKGVDCQIVDWSSRRTNAFLNINTPEELNRAGPLAGGAVHHTPS